MNNLFGIKHDLSHVTLARMYRDGTKGEIKE